GQRVATLPLRVVSGQDGAEETRTSGRKVFPPSSDAVKYRCWHCLSASLRRSYHVTPTTPSRFTATTGGRRNTTSPPAASARTGGDHFSALLSELWTRMPLSSRLLQAK